MALLMAAILNLKVKKTPRVKSKAENGLPISKLVIKNLSFT